MLEICRSQNCMACGRRIDMCGYTSVPEDGRTGTCQYPILQSATAIDHFQTFYGHKAERT